MKGNRVNKFAYKFAINFTLVTIVWLACDYYDKGVLGPNLDATAEGLAQHEGEVMIVITIFINIFYLFLSQNIDLEKSTRMVARCKTRHIHSLGRLLGARLCAGQCYRARKFARFDGFRRSTG